MRTTGLVLVVFGAIVLALLGEGVPDRSGLIQITGQLRSLEKVTSKGGGLSAVRFSLASDPRHFQYISAAGHINNVWIALGQAGQSEVSVLIDSADSHVPVFEDRGFHTAFEIRVGNEMIRAYAQVLDSLSTNSNIGAGLGYGAAATGIALLFIHFLKRRQYA